MEAATRRTFKLTPAEVAKVEAEAEKAKAEARKFRAEASRAEDEAKASHLSLRQIQHDSAKIDASDDAHHVYRFGEDIDERSVQKAMYYLSTWSRLDEAAGQKPSPIEIVFTSPGGSVFDGVAFFDFIGALRRKGHKVTTTALGYAASMAGVLLQAGDIRQIGKESYLHIHEVATGISGKLSDIQDEAKLLEKMTDRTVAIFLSRAGGKITEAQLRRMFTRKEAWFTSDEALQYGLVDRIV